MLTISVNGREKKFNIGCRTFLLLTEVLEMLEVKDREVTHNGGKVSHQEFENTTVKGGDTLGVNYSEQ
jgi:hypothetical protein